MDAGGWIEDVLKTYRAQRTLGERAVAQVAGDADFFATPFAGAPSLAAVMKHVGGNLRSRWRDFLTTDGEKADRNRDGEFDVARDDVESIRGVWNAGWEVALDTLVHLAPDDLDRTVTIRGEVWGVVAAVQRNLTHTAYHTGQIVMLARHLAGDAWTSLSIPLGGSETFNATMRERFPGDGRSP